MTYKTRQTLLGFWLPLSLCLAAANCGDPATGTWVNTTAPSASASQFSAYMTTLTFGDAKSVTVDLESTRTQGAQTYAGCVESTMGTGTYTEANATLTTSLTTGTNSRSGCVYAADNLTSTPLDATTKAVLVGLSSGSFTIVDTTLSLTTSGVTLKYTKQAQ